MKFDTKFDRCTQLYKVESSHSRFRKNRDLPRRLALYFTELDNSFIRSLHLLKTLHVQQYMFSSTAVAELSKNHKSFKWFYDQPFVSSTHMHCAHVETVMNRIQIAYTLTPYFERNLFSEITRFICDHEIIDRCS